MKLNNASERRVVAALRAGKAIDLARDWMAVVALAERGIVETRKAPSGQLEIVGLSAEAPTHPRAKAIRKARAAAFEAARELVREVRQCAVSGDMIGMRARFERIAMFRDANAERLAALRTGRNVEPQRTHLAYVERRIRETRSNLPCDWQNWGRFERRPGFITWATPAPRDTSGERYAIVNYQNSIRWARVSPNPDVSPDYSSGAFYDDMPGGAVVAAIRATAVHANKIRRLVAR